MNELETIRHLRTFNSGWNVRVPEFMTGYSDASYKRDNPDKGGAWGIWVRDANTRILKADVCPDWVTNSNLAEMCGVWAAIHTALTSLEGNILVIKTDSTNVAHGFGWGGSKAIPKHPEARKLLRWSLEKARDADVKLVGKWVKGHQRIRNGSEAYLNDQVDKLATKARLKKKAFKQVERIS